MRAKVKEQAKELVDSFLYLQNENSDTKYFICRLFEPSG